MLLYRSYQRGRYVFNKFFFHQSKVIAVFVHRLAAPLCVNYHAICTEVIGSGVGMFSTVIFSSVKSYLKVYTKVIGSVLHKLSYFLQRSYRSSVHVKVVCLTHTSSIFLVKRRTSITFLDRKIEKEQ